MNKDSIKLFLATSFALLAFAANSVLCRLALGGETIDPMSFTLVRLLSGSIVLLIILGASRPKGKLSKGNNISALMLFTYAISFSYAYLTLDTGTGALILFAAVQATMILANIIKGQKIHSIEIFGFIIAFSGFVYLVLPTLATPSVKGFILMLISGVAWAIYTLRGAISKAALQDTTFNFLRCTPIILILLLVQYKEMTFTSNGLILAVISGGLTSGIGYSIWYYALKTLPTLKAAVLQLLVPILATAGGVLFANEPITLRLSLSSLLVLGGIALVVLRKTLFKEKIVVTTSEI